MKIPDNQPPNSSVTISMLISESVYKAVVAVERFIRWFSKIVIRPCRLLYWLLRW